MFTATNGFVVFAIALIGVILGGAIALILWYLVVIIRDEVRDFIKIYKDERRKCMADDDILFTEWVEQFHKEPLSMMRDYADAH